MTCSYFFYLIGEHNVIQCLGSSAPILVLGTRLPVHTCSESLGTTQEGGQLFQTQGAVLHLSAVLSWGGLATSHELPMISAPCSHPVHGTWPATPKIAGTGFSSLAQRARILFIASFQDLSIASNKVCPKILMAWPWVASSAALPGWQRWLCPKVGGPKLWHCLVKMVITNWGYCTLGSQTLLYRPRIIPGNFMEF